MKTRKKLVLVFFVIVIIIGGFVGWQLFGPTIHSPKGGFLYIKTGSDYHDVKNNLVKNNIVKRAGWFNRIAKYLNYDKSVKPGKYKIDDGMSLINLIRMLKSGRQVPVNLVIVKLRTKEDLAKKIAYNFESDSTAVISFLNNPDSLSKYELDTNTVFTAIIPNTYTFTWNTSVPKIFRRFFNEKNKFWNKQRKALVASLGLSEKQAYILSSIVEEETNKQEDKGKIASVYLNRMQNGMRLSADPTVKFALKDFSLKRIYFKYLSYPSPYNTYLNAGLPPGPICTPSIKTIDAVLNAPATNYLYFVARPDFSGYSNFAEGYEEHKKNAKAYQQALDSLILLKQSN
jgi:UPF0755 protein